MIRLVLIVLTFISFSRAAIAQKVYTYNDKRFIYKVVIDVYVTDDGDRSQCEVKFVSITRRSDHKLIQTIKPPENHFFCDMHKDVVFVAEDMNFDGLNDIRVIQFIPAAPNTPYYYWMYNKTTRKFQRAQAFDNITTPEFDREKKLIFSSWRGGWADYGSSTYKIIKGKPVLVEEYETKGSEDDTTKRIITEKKRIKGKLRLVKRTIENIADEK